MQLTLTRSVRTQHLCSSSSPFSLLTPIVCLLLAFHFLSPLKDPNPVSVQYCTPVDSVCDSALDAVDAYLSISACLTICATPPHTSHTSYGSVVNTVHSPVLFSTLGRSNAYRIRERIGEWGWEGIDGFASRCAPCVAMCCHTVGHWNRNLLLGPPSYQ